MGIQSGAGLLDGKVILMIGIGPLMGQAVARIAAAEGAKVAVAARSRDTIESLATEINAAGGTAMAVQCDVTDEATIKAALEKVTAEFGIINGVFYNAPFYDHAHDGLDIDPELWKTTMDINLMGAIATAKYTVPAMIENGGGSFVFNSSAAGKYADGIRLGYSVSKAGLDAVVRHIARRYGPDNIRANCLYPFVMPVEVPAEMTRGFTDLTCLRRSGTPEEIGNAAVFLLSDRSSYITGEGIHLDGGLFSRAHWPEMGQ
ncbi:SDR family NAD(P)-dependent oxidoreductase [Pseudomaricurvus sp. HS19]|uniref:SDR family NAD(P)-dependent oxidoreductase n=1 Tax=Pseudomaricurvus sp. HS19 TaxID=2692626 RepID=UPI001371CF61|nr:SDR family oxidoreductase [Pseudomaricurvus sp. HS19]MYM62819.1 SDR family oxidoreductase [Pseudomaricurvus sp. HS19]